MMNARPIIFSGQMVRTLLAGNKTQTRRIMKPQPPSVEAVKARCGAGFSIDPGTWCGAHNQFFTCGPVQTVRELMGCEPGSWVCQYGKPGDYLWVRESVWERPDRSPRMMREGADTWPRCIYQADSSSFGRPVWPPQKFDLADIEAAREWCKEQKWKARPSIHMPRWASRLTLHITDVRVERLQDISEEDAKAEGVESPAYPAADGGWIAYDDGKWADGFAALWESIHGAGSWDANPWLWVISFRVIKQNIDDVLKAAA